MRILGFKPQRFAEWRAAIIAEGRQLTWRGRIELVWHMATASLGLGGVARKEWRRRMRVCAKCPVYNRETKQCRPSKESVIGCGCFMPLKSLSSKSTCWARDTVPHMNFGW
jgi:hypothetical protein